MNSEEARNRVAAAVFARLKRDRNKVNDQEVERFLAHLSQCFFETDFNVGRAYRACGCRESIFVPRFQAALGRTPKQYIQHLRMSIAGELLAETAYSVETIAELIGMKAGSFSHAFLKATGERPSNYRKRLESNIKSPLFTLDLGRRIQCAELELSEAQEVIHQLQIAYPEISGIGPRPSFYPGESAPPGHLSREDLEWLNAEKIWFDIQDLTEEEQRHFVQKCSVGSSPILFDFLKKKSIETGRKSRRLGTQVARLALDSAIIAEPLDSSGFSTLQARAWGWLANSQRLNLQLKEAKRSFTMATGLLNEDHPSFVHGEIYHLQAALLWYLNEAKEGIRLESKAIPLLEQGEDRELIAAAYSQRGILCFISGEHMKATANFNNVIDLLSGSPPGHQTYAAMYNLAASAWFTGDYQKSREFVSDLRQMLTNNEPDYVHVYLQRLDGRIALSEHDYDLAVSILTEVRSKLKSLDSNIFALVNLDLAIAFFQKNQQQSAIHLARESLPIIRLWSTLPGFEKPFMKFERGARTGLICCEDLVNIRNLCDLCERTPTNSAKLKLKGIF